MSSAVARIMLQATYGRVACALRDELQEKLESMGAGDAIIDYWRDLDKSAVRVHRAALINVGSTAMAPAVRDGVFRHIEKIARQFGCAWNSSYSCMTLFDIVCKRCPVTVQMVPALCVAVVAVVKKTDDATAYIDMPKLAHCGTQVAQWLRFAGHTEVDVVVTEEAVVAQERRVLDVLTWFVQFPTIESWASVILARLNVLSSSTYVQSLQWIWQTHLFATMRLVMLGQAASPELTSGRAATGLFCLGLAAAGLVPASAFQPEDVTSASWERLMAECQPQGQVAPCLLPQERSLLIVEQLVQASGMGLEDLRESCERVAVEMKRMKAEIQARRPVAQRGANAVAV